MLKAHAKVFIHKWEAEALLQKGGTLLLEFKAREK